MGTLTTDLQTALKQLDPDAASKLERLVRDAIDLAQSLKTRPGVVNASGWPAGYFEKFAGCLAGEQWDLPADPPPEPTPEWTTHPRPHLPFSLIMSINTACKLTLRQGQGLFPHRPSDRSHSTRKHKTEGPLVNSKIGRAHV